MLHRLRLAIRKIARSFYTKKVIKSAAKTGVGIKVNFKTVVNKNTTLGNNFNSNGLIIIGRGKVSIGDNFHCGLGCYIITENHNHKGEKIPYDSTYIVKDTVIGDNVWLGINVTILPGVTIGEGVIVQAGSVVVNDVPPLSIVGGHPAKIFSHRDEEHYFQLKDNKQFH
ncbi:acyltransferase [Klebsiella aerogenes]|uniref:acyltransferase n=1 Tax=Klebsiella aerogenes TaxID=548 RepID=UPI000907E52A|nr:acyltransferase [Klebsiella aerogenes]UNX75340.1 acyltransferase [Klebsiella aerogenes]HBY1606920.1 acyltransferase [Klebsiella aerogenes]